MCACLIVQPISPIVFSPSLRPQSYIDDNIRAIELRLTPAQLAKIEAAAPFDAGFPYNMIGHDSPATGSQATYFTQLGGPIDFVRGPTSLHVVKEEEGGK